MDDAIEVVNIIEDKFKLRGSLVPEHLLDLFGCKFQNVHRGKRFDSKPFINNFVDLGVLEVLDLN